jgi:hypothetical protein
MIQAVFRVSDYGGKTLILKSMTNAIRKLHSTQNCIIEEAGTVEYEYRIYDVNFNAV